MLFGSVLKETQTIKAYKTESYNMALLLEEAIQKYGKLTDY